MVIGTTTILFTPGLDSEGSTPHYDLFISYARRDNERGQVTSLKAHIESSFGAFAGRELRVFLDTHEIASMDDWRQKIQPRQTFDLRTWHDSGNYLTSLLQPYELSVPRP